MVRPFQMCFPCFCCPRAQLFLAYHFTFHVVEQPAREPFDAVVEVPTYGITRRWRQRRLSRYQRIKHFLSRFACECDSVFHSSPPCLSLSLGGMTHDQSVPRICVHMLRNRSGLWSTGRSRTFRLVGRFTRHSAWRLCRSGSRTLATPCWSPNFASARKHGCSIHERKGMRCSRPNPAHALDGGIPSLFVIKRERPPTTDSHRRLRI